MTYAIRSMLPVLLLAIVGCGTQDKPDGDGGCLPDTAIECTCEDGRSGTGTCGVEGCECPPVFSLAAQPASVDFGEVHRGASREVVLVLRSDAPREVRLRSVAFVGEDAAFFSIPDPFPTVLPVGGSLSIVLRLTSVVPDTARARLRIEVDDDAVAPMDVPVFGRVTGPLLSCTPPELGPIPGYVEGRATMPVVCSNDGVAGERDEARLVLDRLVIAGEGFGVGQWEPPVGGLAVGASTTIEVRFEPTAIGEYFGTLTIAGPEATQEVPLLGRAATPPECDVQVIFQRPGLYESEMTLELLVLNLGPDAPCAIRDLRLCDGTDPGYSLQGDDVDRVVVQGGESAIFLVHYTRATTSCTWSSAEAGCLEFEIEPSHNGYRSIPLSCPVHTPVGMIAPDYLDFGTVRPGCATHYREFQIINTASYPIRYRAIGFGEGTSNEFYLRAAPSPGTLLPPGLGMTFEVAYRADDVGDDTGQIWVQVDGEPEPLVATLVGRGGAELTQRDRFQQNARPKVDLLFVVDNGATMGPESARLVADLGSLAEEWKRNEIDFRIAVTTTGLVPGGPGCSGGVHGGEDGRFFPVDGARPRILDRNTPNPRATLEANLAVGTCHAEPPQLLEAALRALTPPLSTNADDPRHDESADGNLGFLRPDAYLWVVAISNRQDSSPGEDEAYLAAFLALKGEQGGYRFSFSPITGDRMIGCTDPDGRSAEAGDRLIDFAERAYGMPLSICGGPWLPRFAISGEFSFKTCFNLIAAPMDIDHDGMFSAGELEVWVDGAEIPQVTDGARAWRYEVAPQPRVCFEEGHVPVEGTQIEVRYSSGCASL